MNAAVRQISGSAAVAVAAPASWLGRSMALLLSAAGLWCCSDQLHGIWQLWTTDSLRSIGLLIPPTSVWLALRAWRTADWAHGGTWWGLALMAAAMAAASQSPFSRWTLQFTTGLGMGTMHFLPVGILLTVYVSGAVLLFGGWTAWSRARFALLLLLLVNPVPSVFNGLVDLPLQSFAARSARAFAGLLAVPVTGDALKLMFSPTLGMFIAPGCNGLRGVATMGLLALIIGHLRALPAARHAAYVLGALMLAYLFNLLRLSGVVIYYWLAVRIPAIDAYGTEVDYLIGGTLFFAAAWFLFAIPRLATRHA